MNREDRAKQFAPFDALKGLKEALRQKEIEHEKGLKHELSDEEKAELQLVFSQIQKGDEVETIYFSDGYYRRLCGIITDINFAMRNIGIGQKKISFDELRQIKIKNKTNKT